MISATALRLASGASVPAGIGAVSDPPLGPAEIALASWVNIVVRLSSAEL